MKVMNTNITDKELADVLSQAGMTEEQIETFLSGCCTEKVHILRNTRRSVLESVHREQAILDRLDYVIWCIEQNQ